MTENDFDVFLPSPLHIAFREAINDVYGWKKGRIQNTAERAIYEWIANNRDKLGETGKEALEAYEAERQPVPEPIK